MSAPGDLDPVALPGGRVIPEEQLRERALTSGGPGGQHANRSATRIELRVSIDALPIRHDERSRLRERLGPRLAGGTDVVVVVGTHRSQLQNRKEARRRLGGLIEQALRVDPPRRKSRPSRGAKRRARSAREQHQQKKTSRRWRPDDDPT